jgi:two-component system, NarL family, sensor histidine kinase UhpB
MGGLNLLRPGERLAVTGNGDVAYLIHTFKEMLDRVEDDVLAAVAG